MKGLLTIMLLTFSLSAAFAQSKAPARPSQDELKAKREADAAKKAEMIRQKKEADSIKKATLLEQRNAMKQNKLQADSAKKASMQEKKAADTEKKKQMMQDRKEATSQKKAAAPAGGAGLSAEEKAQYKREADSIKKAKAIEQREAVKNKKKPGPKAPVTAASNDNSASKLYFTLPIESLPYIQDWIEDNEEEDSKDVRRGFLQKTSNANPNYLRVQRPNEKKYSNLQVYSSATGVTLMAVDNKNCLSGECNSSFKLWLNGAEGWQDATNMYLPSLDRQEVLDRIKAKYKKEYKDLDLYNAKGYENDAIYNRAIMYTVTPEGNIIVKDQYIDFPLYELQWEAEDMKFKPKKI